MNSNKTGWLFLTIVLSFIAVELVISFTPIGDKLSIPALMVISELSFMLPVAVCFLLSGSSLGECVALKGVKPTVAVLSIPYTWMVIPLTMALNMATLFFTDNRASEILNTISGGGIFLTALFAAVAGPICEELAFRGIIYTGIRKSGSALQAIIISGLLFGLFHMNINQAVYAFALGVFFGAVREVTGSIIPPIICHMTVNSGGVIGMIMQKYMISDNDMLAEAARTALTPETLALGLAGDIILAFIGVAIALCLLAYMARKQGNIRRFTDIADKRESSRGKIWGVPLIAGAALSVAFMIFLLILQYMRSGMSA